MNSCPSLSVFAALHEFPAAQRTQLSLAAIEPFLLRSLNAGDFNLWACCQPQGGVFLDARIRKYIYLREVVEVILTAVVIAIPDRADIESRMKSP